MMSFELTWTQCLLSFQNCESNINFGLAGTGMGWNGVLRPAAQQQLTQQLTTTTTSTPVLKDKRLTDSMILANGEFPAVSNEHSYSLGRSISVSVDQFPGNGAASDGDSIPESPLSLQDGNASI